MFEAVVQRTYDAINRQDVHGIMKAWADDAVFELTGRSRISGRYEGKAAIEGFFRHLFARMERIHITVQHVGFANPLGFSYRNTMYVEFEADETTREGQSVHAEVIGVFRIRRGKTVLLRELWLDQSLLEQVWGVAVPVETSVLK